MKNRLLRMTGFILLWLIAFFVFLVLIFPGEVVKAWMERSAGDIPNLSLSIDRLNLSWGLAFVIDDMEIGWGLENRVIKLHLRDARIKPDYPGLIRGDLSFVFDGKIDEEGMFTGRYVDGRSLSVSWQGLRLRDISGLKLLRGILKEDSILSGTGRLRIWDSKPRGSGADGKLRISIKGLSKPFNNLSLSPVRISADIYITGSIEMEVVSP